MKTKISNLGNVLSKKQLTNIHGSLIPIGGETECSLICIWAADETPCTVNHCPGSCDGNGGYFLT